MSDRVFLHVGLPKAGTTYVQQMLTANEERLKKHAGVFQPGAEWSERVAAVRDVRGMKSPRGKLPGTRGSWDRMVAQMAAWPRTSIFSMEWLCVAEPEIIQKIVGDVGPSQAEVVFTVRDLGRTVPASWQEFVKNRGELTWTEYVEEVAADDSLSTDIGRPFWNRQDIGTLIGNWAAAVPIERIHVVTLPQSGAPPDILWQRMCQVLGIESAGYAKDMSGTSNVSLGVEPSELMRRLNPLAREAGIEHLLYHQFFKQIMAKRVLSGIEGRQSRLALPPAYHDWASEVSMQRIEAIKQAGVHVVGDLDELRPVFTAETGTQPEEVSDAVLLAAGLETLVGLARPWDAEHRAALKLEKRNAALTARLARSKNKVERLQGRIERLQGRVTRLQGRVRAFEDRPWRAAALQHLSPIRNRLRRRR